MENSFVVSLLKTFDKQEIREARKFLASPYFNQRADLQLLFELLLKQKSYPSPELQWQQLYPDEAYDAQKMRLLTSYLFKCLEQFIIQREMEASAGLHGHLLLAAYRKKGLSRHFTKAHHQLQKRLDKSSMLQPESHYAQYQIEREVFQQQAKGERTIEHNLQAMEHALSYAFVSTKLKQACWLIAHEAVYKASYQIDLEEAILSIAQSERYQAQAAVAIYYHCYLMLKQPDHDQHFHAFRAQLFGLIPHFPTEEMRDLFLLGINFCIRQINRTGEHYMREALELYQKGLESQLLLENGLLSRFTYNNIAGIALRLQELNWTEQFLIQYRPFLEANQQEAAYSLNAARLAFAKKEFLAVLSFLQKADYKDFINNMVAKTLLLKAYYELGEFDLLEYHLKTMRNFLRRKRRMGYHQQNYNNIVRIAFKLLNFNKQADKMALTKLILQTQPLTERKWLIEKVEE